MKTEKTNSIKAILYALIGNFTIAIVKLIVSIFSKSSAMFAESIHSFVDTTNQIFLLIGNKRSKKEADEVHSFGYGKEEYFWGFLVAVLLFFLGGIYSLYEGVHKIFHPEPIHNYILIFSVIIISIIIEYKSFSVAFKEFNKTNTSKNVFIALKKSTDTNIFVILIEDFSAITGLIIVLITTLLSYFINPFFDIIGTLLVGTLLIIMSYFLSNELRKLMIGENISRDMRSKIKNIVKDYTIVNHINNLRSMYIGNNQFILLISIDIDDESIGYNIENDIDQMKNSIVEIYPNAKYIYIEIKDSERNSGI